MSLETIHQILLGPASLAALTVAGALLASAAVGVFIELLVKFLTPIVERLGL